MAETLTPNSTAIHKQKSPMAETRVQSPTSSFFLGSNDDELERAQARAARAAAFRRKAVDVTPIPPSCPSLSSKSCLNREQIIELFHNCVKLASENKINQKNTWELKLIDHLSEIIKVEAEDNNEETNFQKASCTLEAGVKIYAVRVDAWHADAYRVLSRISRAGLEDEQGVVFTKGKRGTSVEGDETRNEKEVVRPKKETDRKVSPLSTVESSFEALNVKKFDVGFAVDPLYHQTSAQFDEGGAKGLLLYNLGVYGGCWVLFDSQEVPAKCIPPANDCTSSNLVDIFFARDCIEQLVTNMHMKQDISPSLTDITKLLNEHSFPSRISDGLESSVNENPTDENEEFGGDELFSSNDTINDMGFQIDDGACDDAETRSVDHHENVTVSDEASNMGDFLMQNRYEERVPSTSYESDIDDKFENVASLLCGGLGYASLQNGWAGPDHWKYRKPKGSESVHCPNTGSDCAVKRPRSRKSMELDIDFTSCLDEERPDIFVPAKNPKYLLLPPRKAPSSNTLPEDCHYQPEDLVKLFLLPNVVCLGKRRQRRASGSDSWQWENGCDGPLPSCTTEPSVSSGLYDDGYIHSDVEEDVLVSQPCQVDKFELQYDKTSKQVDVHMLKETLWNHIQGSLRTPETKMHEDPISFRYVLATFPDDCQAASTHEISPHLCFICILHLANEHGLTIEGSPNLDDLSIHIPFICDQNTGESIQASL